MIHIAVCDDEINTRRDLAGQVARLLRETYTPCEIVQFSGGEQLLADSRTFEIILLDIKMDGINGMETARRIRRRREECQIIFISALREYVFEAFDVEAAHFLVKPVAEQQLCQTLRRVLTRLAGESEHSLTIYQGGVFKKVPLQQILYCESVGHRVTVYLKSSSETYTETLDVLENRLGGDFFRCHRSYLVHFRFVECCENGFIYLSTGEKLPLAKRRRQDFIEALLQYHRRELR